MNCEFKTIARKLRKHLTKEEKSRIESLGFGKTKRGSSPVLYERRPRAKGVGL